MALASMAMALTSLQLTSASRPAPQIIFCVSCRQLQRLTSAMGIHGFSPSLLQKSALEKSEGPASALFAPRPSLCSCVLCWFAPHRVPILCGLCPVLYVRNAQGAHILDVRNAQGACDPSASLSCCMQNSLSPDPLWCSTVMSSST
eukprot:6188292-Pleurochrysis_carterae.AAC.1